MKSRVFRRPAPARVWVVVVHSKRSSWIHVHTARRLKRDAWDAYLAQWNPEYRYRAWEERKSGKISLERAGLNLA